MAVNEDLYHRLLNAGIPHPAALVMADPQNDSITANPVSDPAPMTAPADLGAAYTQANVNALRADHAALQATVQALLTSLRGGGEVNP